MKVQRLILNKNYERNKKMNKVYYNESENIWSITLNENGNNSTIRFEFMVFTVQNIIIFPSNMRCMS